MFDLFADKTELILQQREPTTSGSVGIYDVRFQFSREWDGLEKIACFRSGSQVISVLLDKTGKCTVPHEVTDPGDKGKHLYVGVYGANGGSVVLPTIWVDLGEIQAGAYCGSNSTPPVPSLWEQALERKQDKLTGAPGQIVGFDANGSAVAVEPPESGELIPGPEGPPGLSAYEVAVSNGFSGSEKDWLAHLKGEPGESGPPGTTDHRALTHREDEDAHPIEAITGLKRELSKRVEADDALSVVDIIKIMEG